jgi:hypothetical protein
VRGAGHLVTAGPRSVGVLEVGEVEARMADRLVIASTVSGGDRYGLLELSGGSAQETARRRGRTLKRSGPVMSGSCLQVCDGCSRPRLGLRPGSLLPHAPVRPGGGRLAAAGPPPWSRLSRMAIALHAQEGPTPYLVRDGSYFLPAAWEITPCRSVLSQRDTEPGIAEDAPGRTGHGHLMAPGTSRRDCPRPARGSLEVFRPDGRAARIRSADCELCPHCLRARRQHRAWTPAGADWLAAPRGWRGTPDSMWHLAGARLAVGCDPAPVPDQRRGEGAAGRLRRTR